MTPNPASTSRAMPVPPVVEALAVQAVQAVQAAFKVHTALGPGLLESAYEACLALELRRAGVRLEQQVPAPPWYGGEKIEAGFRADLLLGDGETGRLLVELKAVETVLPVHRAPVITCLKVLHLPLGLLVNFNTPLIRDGLSRVLNLLPASRPWRLCCLTLP
jgi:GxxExxY protein